jgi:Fe-S-cluster-containing dehydrogenase component
MPVGCLHCEMAPCEQVCPVNATVHDRQGLNVMAYNRCVGTRYCANNCPYKVRRFNFFDYNKRSRTSSMPAHRSRTSTRPRAVSAEVDAEESRRHGADARGDGKVHLLRAADRAGQDRPARSGEGFQRHQVPDGIIRTACQAACPSEAIVFGDISDGNGGLQGKDERPGLRPSRLPEHASRTTYLARLRNPNPKMPDYERIPEPQGIQEYKPVSQWPGLHRSHSDDGHGGH